MQAAMQGLQAFLGDLRLTLCLPQIPWPLDNLSGKAWGRRMISSQETCRARGEALLKAQCFPRNISFLSAGEEVCGGEAREKFFLLSGLYPSTLRARKGPAFPLSVIKKI